LDKLEFLANLSLNHQKSKNFFNNKEEEENANNYQKWSQSS